jgi:DNA-binding IclR family transcriptional regulator
VKRSRLTPCLEGAVSKTVRYVERAINILFCVAESDEPITLSEICRSLDLDKATALRLLFTLQQYGLVHRDPKTRQYGPGSNIQRLRNPWQSDLLSLCRPRLDYLRRSTRETVSLVCARGLERVVVDVFTTPNELSVTPVVGTAHPIYSGASGKVLMAFMPESERDHIIELTGLKPVSPNAVSDRMAYLEILQTVRRNGYAYSIGDVTVGASALAAPIFDANGAVVAVISLRGPEVRMPAERMKQMAPLVMQVAGEISAELGFRAGERRSA